MNKHFALLVTLSMPVFISIGNDFIHIKSMQEHDKYIKEKSHVVVDFYTTHCGACTALEPYMKQLLQELPTVTFLKVDVDKNMDLGRKHKINAVPKIFVYVNGKKVGETAYHGAETSNTIKKMLGMNGSGTSMPSATPMKEMPKKELTTMQAMPMHQEAIAPAMSKEAKKPRSSKRAIKKEQKKSRRKEEIMLDRSICPA
jgi:thioredoxin-like negative regulator of GroEL